MKGKCACRGRNRQTCLAFIMFYCLNRAIACDSQPFPVEPAVCQRLPVERNKEILFAVKEHFSL